MIESPQEYSDTVSLLEELLEFHPEFLDGLSADDLSALSTYYFAGRPVDVPDVLEYRRKALTRHPELERQALAALRQVKQRANAKS
ncbi:hypothetical protein [Kitasatospora sp. NPDC050463]|uniref:hypothetical protein n=1 Tax=Kitasatospora sp. NPDC050463 TaxID=3155786 RepID=UPI0033FAB72C